MKTTAGKIPNDSYEMCVHNGGAATNVRNTMDVLLGIGSIINCGREVNAICSSYCWSSKKHTAEG